MHYSGFMCPQTHGRNKVRRTPVYSEQRFKLRVVGMTVMYEATLTLFKQVKLRNLDVAANIVLGVVFQKKGTVGSNAHTVYTTCPPLKR